MDRESWKIVLSAIHRAVRGHVMGGSAKGYKLHAWMSEDRRIPPWCLTPLNRGEAPIARLLVPLRQDPRTARRHPVSLRQMGRARWELIEVQHRHSCLVRLVYRQRIHAEGLLGNLCGCGDGLTTLPPWVRRLHRVRRRVGGKIILYHARLHARARRKRAA